MSTTARVRKTWFPILALASWGGGGGGGGQAVRDPLPPAAQVAFPPRTSQTDADSVTVRGTASDPDGVAAVTVGGRPVGSLR